MGKRLKVLFLTAAALCVFVLTGAESLYAAPLSGRDAVIIDTLLVKQGLIFTEEAGAKAAAEDFANYANISQATLDEWAGKGEITVDGLLAEKLRSYIQSIALGIRTNLVYTEQSSKSGYVDATNWQQSMFPGKWGDPVPVGTVKISNIRDTDGDHNGYIRAYFDNNSFIGINCYDPMRMGVTIDSWVSGYPYYGPYGNVEFTFDGSRMTLTVPNGNKYSYNYRYTAGLNPGVIIVFNGAACDWRYEISQITQLPVAGNVDLDTELLSNPFWLLEGYSVILQLSGKTPADMVGKTAYDVSITNPGGISGTGHEDLLAKLDRAWQDFKSFFADPIDVSTGAHVIDKTLLSLNGARELQFKISYNSLLLKEGLLGRGWGHSFETRLDARADGDIDICWTANRINRFANNGENRFYSEDKATRFDVLVKNADGSYALTRKDQSVYKFDASGKLVEEQNGHGQSLALSYDDAGRLMQVKEPISEAALTFSYDESGFIDTLTDSTGRQVQFGRDENRDVICIVDANGYATSYSYNPAGRVLSSTDTDGVVVFKNTYDPLGRVAAQDDAISTNELARFSYDEKSEPGKLITAVTDRNGAVRVLSHDSNYQLLSVKDELGNTADLYTYDEDGNRTSATDANSNSTVFSYDAKGNILSITNAAGHTSKMAYDEKNNLISFENPDEKRVLYTYDERNNFISVTDPLGNAATYTYDANGLLLTKTMPRKGTFTYTYERGLPKTMLSPTASTTTLNHDAAGRLISISDAAGNTSTFAYDDTDNLISISDPLGNTTSFTYGSYRERLSQTDANGNITYYSYNGNGKLAARRDALGQVTRYEYDGEDRLVGIIDARGNKTALTYDAKGRLTGTTDALGSTHRIEYDALDNVVKEIDALGNSVFSYAYDALNNPISTTDALGNTNYSHYDNLNRLSQIVDPLSRTTQFGYDDLSRLTLTTDALAGLSKQGFDEDGNLAALIDPNNNQISFAYDLAGRVTLKTNAAGGVSSYSYSALDLLEKHVNARGDEARYEYDIAGRVVKVTDPDGALSYAYDANANVLTATDKNGTVKREYDALDRVIKYTDTYGDTIGYAYDEVGNLATLTYPDQRQVHYEYDGANRLVKVTDWAGRITVYDYNANGRPVKITRPNGTVLSLTYDGKGQVVEHKDVDKDGAVIAHYTYAYDSAGNVTEEKSLHPEKAYALSKATMAYTHDNRLDTFNRQAVLYDEDGNMTMGPLLGTMQDYAYDSRNRLVRAGTTTYTYDAQNNRIQKKEGDKATSYTINPNAPLSQVLAATDDSGNTTYFIYGLGLIADQSGASYKTYHFDRRGSSVALTDENAQITDRFAYAPYGELLYREGHTPTEFLFNGRYGVITDTNGLYYMRARYYNPEIKRFINQDVLLGGIADGQSLNRYAYVSGNPISYVDPFGLSRDGDGFFDNLGEKSWNFIARDTWKAHEHLTEYERLRTRSPLFSIYRIHTAVIPVEQKEQYYGQIADEITMAMVMSSGGGRGSGALMLPKKAGPSSIKPWEIKGKTIEEIEYLAIKQKGLIPKGPNPKIGEGAYIDPITGKQRILSHPQAPGNPHGHVNDPLGRRLEFAGETHISIRYP